MIGKLGLKKMKKTIDDPTPKDIKLKTEQLISSIAMRFVQVIPGVIDQTILDSLEEIQSFTNTDRAYIYIFKQNNKQLKLKYLFNVPGCNEKIAQHDQVDGADFKWMMRSLNDLKPVIVESKSDLTSQASTLKLIMDAESTKSVILVPMVAQGVLMGVIGLDLTREERPWTDDIAHLLTKTGEIFMRVLDQKVAIKGESKPNSNLSELFLGIDDVLFVSTPQGKLVEINPAGLNLFGYDSEWEMMKLQVDRDLFFDQNDHARYIKIVEEQGHIKEYKLALKHKDGSKIHADVSSTVIRDDSGKIIAYAGILREITDKQALEQQIFQSQKMESIGLLAGGIAHDFNNILTAIMGYADLLSMKIGEKDPLNKIVSNILKSGVRAENLVKQLLGFSRKQIVKSRIIDINLEINELNTMLKRLIQADIQLKLDLGDGLKNIKADPVQIQQILVNLVVNAGHAIKEVKGEKSEKFIRISTSEENVTDQFVKQHPGSRSGEFLLISVKDTGIGMDEEISQKIFEPFFSTKGEGKGSGLGLATVYGIVKQNNAYICVDSSPGKGTEFKIYWPLTTETKDQPEKDGTTVKFDQRNECILVAEDDESVRDFACTALKSLGYTVFEAKDGVQALQVIKEKDLSQKLDILFTDMIMPEMRGDELAQEVRKLNPEIKVLLSSGYTESQVYFEGADKRTGYFKLNKPYTIEKLQSKILSVIQHEA